MKYFIALLIVACCGFTYDGNQHFTSDGSQADTQAAEAACSNSVYCTLAIPTGNFNWTGTLTITNLVRLTGAGAGQIITRSTTSLTAATGSQGLTVGTGLNITNNEVLTIERNGGSNGSGSRVNMIGTVTSYNSGTGALVMNVTNVVNGGTAQAPWILYTQPLTIISNASASPLIVLHESSSGNASISGIKFLNNGSTSTTAYLDLAGGLTTKPLLIHDCFFENIGNYDCIRSAEADGFGATTHGVVWNCYAMAAPFSQSQLFIHIKVETQNGAWTHPSTMGSNDVGGTNNFYLENCYVAGYLNAGDFDDNAKAVWRYSTFDNAGTGTHGADSSSYGVRHYEFYENTFLFNGYNNGTTMNVNWWFYLRGGSGVFFSNFLPAISSTDYGTKSSFNMTVMNLQRNAGPHPCWGAGTTNGADYPAPRQVGMGYVTGLSASDSYTYNGDSEPLYAWGNTGSGATAFGRTDFGGTSCASPDTTANYIVYGRDVFTNTVDASYPGAYTYPHPLTLAAVSDPAITIQPQSQSVLVGNTATFTVTATTGSAPLSYQWQMNGINIAGATQSTYSKVTQCSYNGSTFDVVVCNSTNSCVTSANATLTVTGCDGSGTVNANHAYVGSMHGP